MNESIAAKVVTAFKVTALIEALTWVALLIGMYFKYGQGQDEAVSVPGMLHGIAFMVLVVLTAAVAWIRRWNLVTIGLGLLATVLPLCSVIFEQWAQRTGKLDAKTAAEPKAVIG